MIAKDRLWVIAQALQAAVIAEFALEGETLPTRQYIATRNPAWDCEQFTVSAHTITYGLPDFSGNLSLNPASADYALRSVMFSLTIVRCAPQVQPNSPLFGAQPVTDEADEDAFAEQWMLDAVITWNAVIRLAEAGTLGVQMVRPERVDTIGPSGSFGGMDMNVRVLL